jgi:cobalt-precorrin 5A hydrolase
MIVVGIGANNSAQEQDFIAALDKAMRGAAGCDAVATFEAAQFANYVKIAAERASLSFRPVALDALRERSGDCLTRSERTLGLFGVASIAEAAALAGAGRGSRLTMPRRTVGNITIAAAQSADSQGRSS